MSQSLMAIRSAQKGRTIRLVGFNAPETGNRARCPRERELGDRATAQLRSLVEAVA